MPARAAPLPPHERRNDIVQAVLALLAEGAGFPSTRDISRAAGVSEGTLFRAFPTKDALWLALADAALDPAAIEEVLRRVAGSATDLRSLCWSLADQLLRSYERALPVIMLLRHVWNRHPDRRPGQPPPLLTRTERAVQTCLAEVLGAYRVQLSVSPQVAATVLQTLALGPQRLGVVDGGALSADQVADVMMGGVSMS